MRGGRYCYDNPTASETRVRGALHRLTMEAAIKERKDEEALAELPDTRFQARMTKLQKSKIKMVYTHSGVWQKFVRGEEEEWAWSCCQNEDEESRGCVRRVQDNNKSYLASC